MMVPQAQGWSSSSCGRTRLSRYVGKARLISPLTYAGYEVLFQSTGAPGGHDGQASRAGACGLPLRVTTRNVRRHCGA
jgi:hypothetical protein